MCTPQTCLKRVLSSRISDKYLRQGELTVELTEGMHEVCMRVCGGDSGGSVMRTCILFFYLH